MRNALLRAWRAQHPGRTAAPHARFPCGARQQHWSSAAGATTRSAVYALPPPRARADLLVNRDADEVASVVGSFADACIELIHLESIADVDAHLRSGDDGEREGKRELAVVVGAIPGRCHACAVRGLI